jgi:hypothetical protein
VDPKAVAVVAVAAVEPVLLEMPNMVAVVV